MPRRKIMGDWLSLRLPTGTIAEITAVLEPSETVQALVRSAVVAELARRVKLEETT